MDRDIEAGTDIDEDRVLDRAAARKDTAEDREPELVAAHKDTVVDKVPDQVEVDKMWLRIVAGVEADKHKGTVKDKESRPVGVAEVPRQAVADKDSVEQKDLDT